MLGRPAVLATLFASAALALLPEFAAANGWPCGVRGARIVKESPSAVVAKQRLRGGPATARYYGCLKSTDRAVLLAEEGFFPDRDEVYVDEELLRIRGRFVVIAVGGCLAECAPPGLDVFDLGAGRRVRSIYPRGGYSDLRRLYLTSGGALGYVTTDFSGRHLVCKADAAGHVRLARGSPRRLPLSSVAVQGRRLTWKLDGRRHSVRLRDR
jgi:hypothetical protein